MKSDMVIAGVGGQGILTVASLIAQTALAEGLNVKQSEVHGMAQRGGAVEAHLRLSSSAIFSDLVPLGGAQVVLGMEPLEALRQLRFLAADGWVFSSSDPVQNIADYPPPDQLLRDIRAMPKALVLPATEMARQAGHPRASNMVLVGAASALLPLAEATFRTVITQVFRGKGDAIVEINLKAFAAGREMARLCVCG